MIVIGWILSAFLELAQLVVHPTAAAACPSGWWLATGVQRDGSFACWLDADREDWPARDKPHLAVLVGRVCCSGAMYTGVPVQDGTRVWCKEGPSS